MPIAVWLVAMVGPLVARLLVACGFSLVTLVGVVAAVATLKGLITGAIGSLPLALVQLAGLVGVWECIGMMLGTTTFLIAWKGTAGFWALAKT